MGKQTISWLRVIKAAEYLLVFMIVINFRSVWVTTAGTSAENASYFLVIILSTFLFAVNSFIYHQKWYKSEMVRFVLITVLLLISTLHSIIQGSGIEHSTAPIIFAIVLTLAWITEYKSGRFFELINVFVKLMFVITCASLFFWMLSMLNVPTNSSISILWGGLRSINGYFHIHYLASGSNVILGINIVRNTAFFSEAPMYSFLICIALAMHLFLQQRSSSNLIDKRTIIFLITIFTTASTTGVIVGIISVVATIIFQSSNRVGRSMLMIVGLGILVYIIIYLLEMKSEANVWSVSTRMDDVLAGIAAWKIHPWFGSGLGNFRVYMQYISQSRLLIGANSGYSSGIFQILFTGGIYYFVAIVIIPFLGFMKINRNSYVFGILFVILLFNTIVDSTALLFFVVSLGYSSLVVVKGFGKEVS
ncbi:O-antigen ligase family protein [Lactiplantibacillus plantarum]|uniref:O-antigen ligase family protein n=1 Tax=Lactiplantibacillus plantarum TaxID=1590 RepID=UPI003B511B06